MKHPLTERERENTQEGWAWSWARLGASAFFGDLAHPRGAFALGSHSSVESYGEHLSVLRRSLPAAEASVNRPELTEMTVDPVRAPAHPQGVRKRTGGECRFNLIGTQAGIFKRSYRQRCLWGMGALCLCLSE